MAARLLTLLKISLLLICFNAYAITYAPNGTSGLNLVYNGNVDDTSFAVNLPWSINFLGTNYNTLHVGSNGYITFQGGSSTYSGFSASNPPGPHISIYPADRRLYKLYYAQIDAGTATAKFVIRVEGVDYSNGDITHIYEIHFYPNDSYFDVYFIDTPSSGNTGTAGISNGSTYVSTFTATELTGLRINANGTIDTGTPTYSSGITTAQQSRKTSESAQRTSQSGNGIYIEQIGDNNQITIRQGITITGKNRIELYANGNNNTLNLNQGYNADGSIPASEYNNHYQYLNMSGASNSVTTKQINGNSTVGHFMETTISGNTNTVNATQQGTGSKTLFLNVNGGSNGVTVNQKDGGQHYLDLSLTGNGHTVNATQEGAGNHAATINLTNSGGAATLNLNQSGSTGQTYSINQSCANASGCSTTITQP